MTSFSVEPNGAVGANQLGAGRPTLLCDERTLHPSWNSKQSGQKEAHLLPLDWRRCSQGGELPSCLGQGSLQQGSWRTGDQEPGSAEHMPGPEIDPQIVHGRTIILGGMGTKQCMSGNNGGRGGKEPLGSSSQPAASIAGHHKL